MRTPRSTLSILVLLVCGLSPLTGCNHLEWQALRLYLAANPHLDVADGPHAYSARSEELLLVPIVDGLEFPWDFAFLDDATVLVTEKPGRLSRVDLGTGVVTAIGSLPEVAFVGQGGLLGVERDPDFEATGWIYLSYAIAIEGGYTTRLSRARIRENDLVDHQVLFTARPVRPGVNHFGGALEFDRSGLLYLSVGDRQERVYAQDLGAHLGKILRLERDGGVPPGNPFVGDPVARPRVFSFGHRNPQGLARHPETGELWEAEHGPRGGDEINVVRTGRNYGWPVISHGQEYGGGQVGVGTNRDGLEQPVHSYVPSIATAGIGFYRGDGLPSWSHSLLVAGLIGTQVHRLSLDGEHVVEQETLFADLWQRVRAIHQAPNRGALHVLTENGILFRIEPGA